MNAADKPIRVMICDDDPRVRTTLARVLLSQPDLLVVGSVASGEELLAEVAGTDPDVILLDVCLPGIDGTEVARRLRFVGAPSAIVLLTADDRAATHAAQLERCWFLSKGVSGAHRVIAAVRGAAA